MGEILREILVVSNASIKNLPNLSRDEVENVDYAVSVQIHALPFVDAPKVFGAPHPTEYYVEAKKPSEESIKQLAYKFGKKL